MGNKDSLAEAFAKCDSVSEVKRETDVVELSDLLRNAKVVKARWISIGENRSLFKRKEKTSAIVIEFDNGIVLTASKKGEPATIKVLAKSNKTTSILKVKPKH